MVGYIMNLEKLQLKMMKIIEDKGGFTQCFKSGWVEEQINDARFRMAESIESGDRPLVGVNIFREEGEKVNINIFRQAENMQSERVKYVTEYRASRNRDLVQRALDKIYDLTRNQKKVNVFDSILEAVDAGATLQEICDAMRRASDFEIPE